MFARNALLVHPEEQDVQSEGRGEADVSTGFEKPASNYFKVPFCWTDLTRPVQSAAVILVVEYFFRHGWGYQNDKGVWLEAEEVVAGRCYANGQRYDNGIGYDTATVYRALHEAVARGFLVWVEEEDGGLKRRKYNLYLQGMAVAEDGRYLGLLQRDQGQEKAEGSGAFQNDPICIVEEVICTVDPHSVYNERQPHCEVEAGVCKVEAGIRKVEEDVREVEEGACEVEVRSGATDTLADNSLRHRNQIPTTAPDDELDQPLWAVVVAADSAAFLRRLGVHGAPRRAILKAGILPSAILAWALYTWSQDSLNQNKAGYLVRRLRDADDQGNPPQDFLAYAEWTVRDWVALFQAQQESRLGLECVLPVHLAGAAAHWMRVYRAGESKLPPGLWQVLAPWISSGLVTTAEQAVVAPVVSDCEYTPDESEIQWQAPLNSTPVTDSLSASACWAEALVELKNRVNEMTYRTWLEMTWVEDYQEGHFSITNGHPAVADMAVNGYERMRQHIGMLAQRVLTRQLGRLVQVSYGSAASTTEPTPR